MREESKTAETRDEEPPPPAGPWVLLVSGRPEVQQVLAQALGSSSCVVVVDQLRAALAALRVRQFQAAVVDLVLPDSSGRDALASFKQTAPELPIVFLTCLRDPLHESRLARWGARAHVRLDSRQQLSIDRLYAAFERAGVAMPSAAVAGAIPEPASVSTTLARRGR